MVCRRLYKGELLTKTELQDISQNYFLTPHAKQRLEERNQYVDLKNLILSPTLAYFNTDGSINIALNEYEYIVVKITEHMQYPYTIITFKEKSFNGIDIFAKRDLALQGKRRRNMRLN